MLVDLSQSMESKITQLQSRPKYQENYSRQSNIRIKGVPEGIKKEQSVIDCVKDLLQCLFTGTLEESGGMTMRGCIGHLQHASRQTGVTLTPGHDTYW